MYESIFRGEVFELRVHKGPGLIALRNVIDAREASVADFVKQIGVTRQGLYKMLSEDENPRLSTLSALLKSLGMKMQICGEMAA
ncbi:helix-turn-helix domain-containing protein [Desulfosarcina sp. BuS5]|uniref:helix-turn-helix domain-containing transcriptional regulator n=1 Tax=Desulfosarcina sp. BuS5 TaxID=933262 RepID=UPI0005560A30